MLSFFFFFFVVVFDVVFILLRSRMTSICSLKDWIAKFDYFGLASVIYSITDNLV